VTWLGVLLSRCRARTNPNIVVFVVEESLAHKVCLLVVQLHVDTNKPAEALKLITYIESQFVSTENATNILTGSADQGGPIHAETDKTEKVHYTIFACESNSQYFNNNCIVIVQKTNLDAATDAFRVCLIQYRVRCLMTLNLFEECGQQLNTIKEKQVKYLYLRSCINM